MKLNEEIITNDLLHSIIDDVHPDYKPYSDEEMILKKPKFGVYKRSFRHKSGKITSMKWRVYYGTPKTVYTVFTSLANK
jgi:hypothetical protein